jgi:hypothetical protein
MYRYVQKNISVQPSKTVWELQSIHKPMHCITHLHCMLVCDHTYFYTVSQPSSDLRSLPFPIWQILLIKKVSVSKSLNYLQNPADETEFFHFQTTNESMDNLIGMSFGQHVEPSFGHSLLKAARHKLRLRIRFRSQVNVVYADKGWVSPIQASAFALPS